MRSAKTIHVATSGPQAPSKRRTLRAGIAAAALSAFMLAFAAGPAGATTTHKYLGSFPIFEANPQVGGVDAQGNVYVYDSATDTVHKYDQDGNPVNFSALGTNVIDGKGNGDCLNTPSDCDQVPRNGLFGNSGNGGDRGQLAVDPRASGPGAGYIYVTNFSSSPQPGHVEVFDPSGKFVGELDNTITFPSRCVGTCSMLDVTVDSNGHVYIAYFPGEADQYAPVDGNPAHDVFVGQLRGDLGGFVVGGNPYSYGKAFSATNAPWKKYTAAAWLKPQGNSDPIDFSPAPGPFGDGGAYPKHSSNYIVSASIDPATQHVYLLGPGGYIEEWDPDNHQVGPPFGNTTPGNGGATTIGFDTSNGHIFMKGTENGGRSVAEYSGPVTIPDVTYSPADIGHNSFTVHGHLSLDGGPQVDACRIEYGSGLDSFGNPLYGNSVSCDQMMPMTGDGDVSATISGLQIETDYHYRIVATNSNGESPGADRVAHPSAVLGLTTGAATDIDRDSATLHGSLNPDSLETRYHFEYGLDTTYGSETPEETIPAGTSGQVDVTPAELTELQSGRVYHYRIVARNSLGTTFGPDRTFQAARSPALGGIRAVNVTETSADLTAQINPSGYDTSYYFEYGPTPSYGSTVPVTPADIGGGTDPVPVSEHLSGLQSGVTYHFRVVATNQWGTSASEDTTFSFFPPNCPNEHVRQQTSTNYLPDCRAYELVSPRDAGGVQLFPSTITLDFGAGFGLVNDPLSQLTVQNSGWASSPSRFSFYGGIGAVSGLNPPNTLIDLYVSSRTEQGWVTTYPGIPGNQTSVVARPQCAEDLGQCLGHRGPSAFAADPGENSARLFDVSGASLGTLPTNVSVIPGGTHFVGDQLASGDLSHYVFSSRDLAFAPGGLTSAPGSAYDNEVRSGAITIVSKLANGDDIGQDGGPPDEFIKIRAISRNGSHILMSTTSLSGPVRLYMRVDDAVTYDVSRGMGVQFIGMTSDGSKVLFASNNQLTPDDTDTSGDVYLWSEQGNELTRLSEGNGNGNSDDCNATFTPQCNATPIDPERGRGRFDTFDVDDYIASQSGDIYFYSPEQLDPESPGVANQRNLYVFHKGAVEYVTTLDPGTKINRMQISPDGSHAAFVTASQLTGYDNKGFREMYTYNPDTGAIRCASCDPSGAPPTGDVEASAGGRFMSDDGRAFFGTPDALVPQDTNGLIDVYEYVDGRPQLITAGTGERDLYAGAAGGGFFPPHHTGLEAVSHNGIDVYFSTFDTLVPEDHNGPFVKFYDARTNGGFPFDPGLLPCAAADECHGPGSSPPTIPALGSGQDLGARGQAATPKRKKRHGRKQGRRKAKHKRHGKHRRHAKHRRARHARHRTGQAKGGARRRHG